MKAISINEPINKHLRTNLFNIEIRFAEVRISRLVVQVVFRKRNHGNGYHKAFITTTLQRRC